MTILMEEDNEMSKQEDKIVSIVGFGGPGKTTLANVVYRELKPQFDCSAFVSVSQNPDMVTLFKDMFYQFAKYSNASVNVVNDLRDFLEEKRYLIVIDDIWDIPNWRMIKCAFPENNVGCKIITTTHIVSVAEQIGGAYKLRPLSLQYSRKLLYGRIFGNENIETYEETEQCPDEDLAEVSDKIVKKCAGVPLAIITIASLLAHTGRNKMDWYEVYHSVGNGLEHSLDTENMRTILSYSYYNLPPRLRTCLLYLSMFPEDYIIKKDHLIWLWIAEGFIEPIKGRSLFEDGESYLNELINRSMIQRASIDDYTKELLSCRVHDVVLDLLRSLSREENFVTLISDMDDASTSPRVRRLSFQNAKVDHATIRGTWSTPQVRSVFVIPSAIAQMPTLQSFKVLRVLDLESCDLSKVYTLEYLGNLLHLRYLGLRDTEIHELPEVVGDLRYLEILNSSINYINSLPSTVAQIKHLLCLSIDSKTRLPNGIKNLTPLEELSWLGVDIQSRDTIEELGYLTKLKVLRTDSSTGEWNDRDDKLLESLRKLRKIQSLFIEKPRWDRISERNMGGLDALDPSRRIRSLQICSPYSFSTLPNWMNNLFNLSILWIRVRGLQQEYLDVLGRLPALQFLRLQLFDHDNDRILGRFNIGWGSFPRLVNCCLQGDIVGPVVFQQGAMPRLPELSFDLYVSLDRDNAGSDGGFDVGLGNLPFLQEVGVNISSQKRDSKKAEEAEAAMRHAAEIHPNKPRIYVQHWTI